MEKPDVAQATESHPHLDSVAAVAADRLGHIPDGVVDAWIASPPFETMRHYSDDPRDLGNCQGKEFVERLVPVIREWDRTLKPTGNLLLNFMPQSINGIMSPTSWLLPQALSENGLHVIQELYVVKTNAMPSNDEKILKPCVERVIHAVKDPRAFVVFKDAVRRPSLWAARDNRPWKYRADGADGGNFIAPALERLNRMTIKDVLGAVCAEDANAIFIAKTQDQATIHPAKMADEVARWLVAYGSPPGGIVGDNFVGSGTTVIAAKALGRHYIGSDLSAAYVTHAEAALAAVEFGSLLGPEGAVCPGIPVVPAARAPQGFGRRQPRPPITGTCPTCGNGFSQTKRWQTYCSDHCRYAHHNRRHRRGSHDQEAHRS